MTALSPRDRRALTSGAIVLGALLTYAWGVRPWLTTIATQRTELLEQQGLLSRERSLVDAAARFPRTRTQFTQVLATSRTRLFAGDFVTATAALASYIDDVATATGLHVTSVEGRLSARSDALTTVSVELRADARFSSVLAFLRAVESAGYLINVPAIRAERGQRGDMVAITATLSAPAGSVP